MKNILKKDIKKLGDIADYIAKYNVMDGSWVLEIVAGKNAVGMLFTERCIIRTFKSLMQFQTYWQIVVLQSSQQSAIKNK